LRLISLIAEPLEVPNPAAQRAEMWARNILSKFGEYPTIPEPTNIYQWSRAVLRLRAPASLAEVLRLEADSKFFRSLFVVFAFLALCSFVHLPGYERMPLSAWISLILAGLSYWRYAERRHAGITEAYRSAIILFALGQKAAPPPDSKDGGDDG
jgi:hypothetical protein